MCQVAAAVVHCDPSEMLPSSTGIIGHPLRMPILEKGIIAVGQELGRSSEHALAFADSILTTDLKRKTAATSFKLGKQTVTLAGVCKGSGMIGPRMALAGHDPKALHATMLAYLTTDARIAPARLRHLLGASSDASFNAVTVDDHTSTNDTACIMASGQGAAVSGAGEKKFARALDEICQHLAYQIAADGEGATKVVKIVVRGAKSVDDAAKMARAIANSPLVKCAMHGNDPNWGRIVSAAGMCDAAFDPDRATLTLQGAVVFRNGRPVAFDAPKVSKSLDAKEVLVDLACRLGNGQSTCWTCDLSKQYVTINADYHT